MQENRKGSEFYALKRYAVDIFNNQIYASDCYDNNIYLDIGTNGNKHEIFAKTKDKQIYFAKNNKGNFILPIRGKRPYYFFDKDPVFPVNDQNIPVYGEYNQCQIYPNDGATDIYLKIDGSDTYALNSNGDFYYASKLVHNEWIQFFGKDKNNDDILIYYENGEVRYPINVTQNKPIYDVEQNKEIYFKMDGNEIYGRNSKNLPIYARQNSDEYFATDKNQVPYYGSYKNVEFYPKRSNNDQIYIVKNDVEIPAFNKSVQYYAQKGTQEPFYPMDFSL